MRKAPKSNIIGIFSQIVFALFAFTSCISPANDFFVELGYDYAEEIENYCIVKIIYRVPDKDRNPYQSDPFNTIIPGKVVNYNYDDNHIIVHQRYDRLYSFMDTLTSEHDKDSIIANYEMLKKINNCYWIIYKKKDIVAGPFNKHDFDVKCKKERIKLEFEDEHRLFW